MSDLNDWVLEVAGVETPFGTETTDYPFSTQVSLAEAARVVQDGAHPTSDGALMGRDRLRGFIMQFACKVLQEYPVTAAPWMNALDVYGDFAAKWRGDAIRLTPGAYATIRNLERGRMAYGRPRGIAPKFGQLRKGYLDFQMDFATITPDFYSIVGDSIAGSGTDTNAGNIPAWPVITIVGLGAASIAVSQDAVVLWEIEVPDGAGGTLIIDTRPWARGALLDGDPANGMLRGTRLEDCRIPVGEFDIAVAGGAVTTAWHSTYASL